MNSRQAIVKDDEVRALLDKLLAGPQRIVAQQDALEQAIYEEFIFADDIQAKEVLANIEAETAFEIRAEKNGDGKALYTNEEQRTAAVRLACAKDPEYVKVLSAVTAAQHRRAEMKMRIGKLVNQVKHATNEYYAHKTALEVVAGLAVEDVDAAAHIKLAQLKQFVKTLEEK
jgi:hypothetical protein